MIESDYKDISNEAWREYEWIIEIRGVTSFRTYRIDAPQKLVLGTTTHRIIDGKGVVHCVPCVGLLGCVLRWQGYDGDAMTF